MMAPAPRKLRVINFLRVSTDRQETERQQFDLDDNAEQFGLNVAETVRLKISGPKVNTKKEWRDMLEKMKLPAYDGINLSALDRLFRPEDFAILGEALQVFIDHQKVIVSTKEGLVIEPWTPRGWQICMEAVTQAGKELAELKRRTAGGRRKAHAHNLPMNTTPPYGVLYVDKYGRINYGDDRERDPEGRCQCFIEDLRPASNGQTRREVVVMVFDWRYRQGWRVGTIATELNRRGILSAGYMGKGGEWVPPGPWTRQSVLQLLKNRHYIGEHWEGEKRVNVGCPCFIDDREVFDGVQKMGAKKGGGPRPRKRLLCGWLRCGACTHSYRSTTGSRRGACYACGRVNRKRQALCHANSQVLCETLDNVVFGAVWALLTDAALLLENAQAYYDSLPGKSVTAKLEREAATLRGKVDRLQDMIDAGAGDHKKAIASQLEYQKRIDELQGELKAAGSVMALPQAHVVRAALAELAVAEDAPESFDERRPILEKLIDFKVVYDKGVAEITGKVPVPNRAYNCRPRVGADSHRQRENGDRGDATIRPETTARIANIANESIEPQKKVGVAGAFVRL